MTEVFTAETTIDRPVDEVWARLIDWDLAAQWMPGVDALHAHGPTATGTTLVFTTRGKKRTGHIAALEPGRSITLRSIQGGLTGDYVYACPARREHARQPGGRLPDDRSRTAARASDQICHPQRRQPPARRIRRHVRIRIGAAMSSTTHTDRLRANGRLHRSVDDKTHRPMLSPRTKGGQAGGVAANHANRRKSCSSSHSRSALCSHSCTQ